MTPKKQNPGMQAGASRIQLVGCLQNSLTSTDWRSQLIASRYCLPPATALAISRELFGEVSYD